MSSRHCTLHGRIVSLKQDPEYLHYKVTWPKSAVTPLTPPASVRGNVTPEESLMDDTEALLKNYFNLQYDLTELYKQWAAADPNFRRRAPTFEGVRMLNQDAWEALVGFICSSNNNIARISQMVHKLCLHYGPLIGNIAGEPLHDFPTPTSLTAPGVEAHLRSLGFGYRARYISETARSVSQDRHAGWLQGLRNPAIPAWAVTTPPKPEADGEDSILAPATYKHAHEQLLQLSGVGPKVADCVCLMGLGWAEAVPVDTHVWQIAMRDYNFGGKSKNKTLTKVLYDAVGDHFRLLWGDYAGWAHSVLFTADLRAFSERSVEKAAIKKESEEVGIMKVEAIKAEILEDTLITPTPTPRGTPAKRRRAVADQITKVEIKEEPGIESQPGRVLRKRRKFQS